MDWQRVKVQELSEQVRDAGVAAHEYALGKTASGSLPGLKHADYVTR